MRTDQVIQRFKTLRIIPVVRTPDAESALRAIDALIEGGIPCAEITMTVHGAVSVIEAAAKRFGDKLLLGAGTVLDPETARICILAGADFIVSPSLNRATIELAKRYSKAVLPGALTPTEIVTAWEAGADAVKVFPCGALGGAKYIKSLRGPFPDIDFVPTGGVNLDTVADFLAAGCCAVGVGGELVDPALLARDKYGLLVERARQFRGKVLAATVREGN
jgi:2-dehydro-3-deoxyphosphogluconate aldolase/(4S)-4-hydroxy-2-oxoglutarate aldolase